MGEEGFPASGRHHHGESRAPNGLLLALTRWISSQEETMPGAGKCHWTETKQNTKTCPLVFGGVSLEAIKNKLKTCNFRHKDFFALSC